MGDGAADELSCQDLVELVTDYLEDALPFGERARFEAHLRECPPCVEYVAQVRTTIRLAGGLSAETIDPAARDHLLAHFRNWRSGPRAGGR